MVSRRGMVVRLAGVEAMDDGVQQFLLQPPCDLGARDQSSFGFREMAGLPDQALEFRCFRARRTEYPAACFDIFSPPPGDSEVISHFERLSSKETKIAPRSVRIAVSVSGRSFAASMFGLSRVRCSFKATSLWHRADRYPPSS